MVVLPQLNLLKLNLWKYARHLLFDHEIDLKKDEADLVEYENARGWWLFRIENSSEEDLKKLPCDYDSDLEKRYSDYESEEESNPNLSSDQHSEKTSSSNQSSSESSSEDSAGSSHKKKKRSKKVQKKEAPNQVSKDQHDTDMKDLKNLLPFRIQAIEDKVENEKKILANKFEEQIR